MEIGILFQFVNETIEVRIKDSNVFFRTSQFTRWGDISGIRLDKAGVTREFPDLKDNKEWQSIAKERFKEKIKKMKNNNEIANYIIEDLTKFGYKPLYLYKEGFRPIRLNN